MRFAVDIEPLDEGEAGKGWTIKIAAPDRETAEKGLCVVHGFLHGRGADFLRDIQPLHSAMATEVEGVVELTERVVAVHYLSDVRPLIHDA